MKVPTALTARRCGCVWSKTQATCNCPQWGQLQVPRPTLMSTTEHPPRHQEFIDGYKTN